MLYADLEAQDMEKQSPEHRKKMVASIIITVRFLAYLIFHGIAVFTTSELLLWAARNICGHGAVQLAPDAGGPDLRGGEPVRVPVYFQETGQHEPRILIFDEATSALNNLTQKKVSESLDRLKCARIVVARQRLDIGGEAGA